MIEFSEAQLERAEAILRHIPGAAPKAAARAINRASESARTEAARKVRETYYISYRDVLSTIKIDKASADNLSAKVTSRGHATDLIKFDVTPNRPQPNRKTPIIVRVKQGSGGPVKHAFVARMRNGHVSVFERAGKARVPITALYGPPVPEMIGAPSVRQWVEQKAGETLEQRLEHEIDRILEGNA